MSYIKGALVEHALLDAGLDCGRSQILRIHDTVIAYWWVCLLYVFACMCVSVNVKGVCTRVCRVSFLWEWLCVCLLLVFTGRCVCVHICGQTVKRGVPHITWSPRDLKAWFWQIAGKPTLASIITICPWFVSVISALSPPKRDKRGAGNCWRRLPFFVFNVTCQPRFSQNF